MLGSHPLGANHVAPHSGDRRLCCHAGFQRAARIGDNHAMFTVSPFPAYTASAPGAPTPPGTRVRVTVCVEDTARGVYGVAAAGPAFDSGYRRHDIVSAVTGGYDHTQCRATLARYTSHLVVGRCPGTRTARSASAERSRGSTDALHICMNVAFYPIDWVERHIHLIASTSITGILAHNTPEIALRGPIWR